MSKMRGTPWAPAQFHMPGGESFIGQLSHDDLQKLRMVIKRVHMRYYPKHMITDHEADKILESEGRAWSEMALKVLVDKKLQDK